MFSRNKLEIFVTCLEISCFIILGIIGIIISKTISTFLGVLLLVGGGGVMPLIFYPIKDWVEKQGED